MKLNKIVSKQFRNSFETVLFQFHFFLRTVYLSDQRRGVVWLQNETAYHAVDGTDGHVDMDNTQQGKRRARKDKDKKVDLDNLKREVEMVRTLRSTSSVVKSLFISFLHRINYHLYSPLVVVSRRNILKGNTTLKT